MWSMAATVAMGFVRALSHFLWRSKIAFPLSFLGKRRQMVSLTCQVCCCYYFMSSLCPLAAFALCSSTQRYTEWLWAEEEKTSSRTKQKVCSHANLINNGELVKRNGTKKKIVLVGKRGNVLYHCKEGMWKVKPFKVYITPHKTKFRLFHSYCKI